MPPATATSASSPTWYASGAPLRMSSAASRPTVGAVVYELTPEVVDLETAFFNLTDNRTKELAR